MTHFLPHAHYDCTLDVRLSITLRHQFFCLMTDPVNRVEFCKKNTGKIQK